MATETKKPAGKTQQSGAKSPAKAAVKEVAGKEAKAAASSRKAATPKAAAASAKPRAAASSAATSKSTASTAEKSAEQTMKTTTPSKAKTSKKSAGKTQEIVSGAQLTEEQLLAMPEDDYMNAVQLDFFRHKLVSMREEILENARETGEHLKENEVFADPSDRATVEEENMLEQRVRDRERKLLKKINASIQRIEDGSYGFCLDTGEPIGLPRLLARPTAELSIEAQEKHERMEKLYAD